MANPIQHPPPMDEVENMKKWLESPTGLFRRNGKPQTNRDVFNLSELEVRAGVPERGLHKWLAVKSHQELAIRHIPNLLDVLTLYGYRPLSSKHRPLK